MPCVFCGGSPTTNEHVFPRWLERFLPPDRRQVLELSRYGENGYERALDSVGLGFRVNRVCAPCNGGWMSRLEEESIPVLSPLIEGLNDVELLSLRDQRQIALWATKTAMMTDLTQADPILRPDQRFRLRTHRAIPGGTRIWMGACDALSPIVTSHTVRVLIPQVWPPATGFFSPMKIGRLCLYVYFPQTQVVVRHAGIYRTATARIWPRRASDLPVPAPARPRTGEEFEQFADAFWREMQVIPPDDAAELGLLDN